eukprot:CAMPEP_0202911056 /NCGR_PEP_ID=MMETSP1392-20130828/53914_1 /ASSEMBLY_ACC=CAM_ASM_000868 /TAXON_ID=225041 /ORGANISM="Chlamydomonas chlamydogama, Strain SAG 11-48b" /LENGTH=76 /DNA_ID=CAMNT_0049601433 /DNA_START=363 /DNA_END=589 /DNA_ORIENTATION=+
MQLLLSAHNGCSLSATFQLLVPEPLTLLLHHALQGAVALLALPQQGLAAGSAAVHLHHRGMLRPHRDGGGDQQPVT